jgi:energy-coupling factor transport system permease protein
MECRCYHGGDGRTRMKQLNYTGKDYIALVGGVVILAAVILLGIFGL